KIDFVGDYKELKKWGNSETEVIDYRGRLILPGFIDSHVHFPQTKIIGSYGEQLIDWLNNYAFPEEVKFSDEQYAAEMAALFVEQLLANGTTTAMAFATVHKGSVDALFSAAEKYDLRMLAGKVMMDRNGPENLLDTPETGYRESKELIEKWHNRGRFKYALTPRFAPTSTSEQLKKAGELLKEYPGLYLQTHLSE
ncbi:MAG: amidohydrolase family protein, partial [Proteobacteria bacterium]|nr:amidohydrolase family protein [Pseudomonadota bacterium]